MATIKKIIARSVKIIFLLLLLGCVGVIWYAWRESLPVLQPYTPAVEEIKEDAIEKVSFTFTGADGVEIPALIVKKNAEGKYSPRQSKIRDMLKRRANVRGYDDQTQVVLISTSWDNGIQSAMPYAEVLCGAGFTCVVWEPRGIGQARQYCTYGLEESKDVPLLLDALKGKVDRTDLVAAFGKDFGAALLIQAAAKDVRIRSLVSIDNFCILKKSLMTAMTRDMGQLRGIATFWLVDVLSSMRAGYSSFDVVPVDSARALNIPAMFVCADKYAFTSMDDAVKLYQSLGNGNQSRKSLYVPLEEGEPFGTTEREYVVMHELKNGDVKQEHYMLNVYEDDDQLMTIVIEWLAENTLPPLPELILQDSFAPSK